MTFWLFWQTLRQAPRRSLLGALGVAFPVAMLAATLLYLDLAVSSMTTVALEPVQVEQRALATSLDVNMTEVSKQLAQVPGVSSVDRFATANVVVSAPGAPGAATARLFAVDPKYIHDHPWVNVVKGSLNQGALLDQSLTDYAPGFGSASKVTIQLPGAGGNGAALSLPAGGIADLRGALPTWFSIPAGDVQGDIALVPRAIVIPYRDFEKTLLPAFISQLGPKTPVLNPGLQDLPPLSLEAHVSVDHNAYPSDPGKAVVWSGALRRVLERQTTKPGEVFVSDNAAEPLTEASADATNAKILFLLLGIPGALVAAALGLAAQSALAEAQRREDGLMRIRGATEGQLARLAGLQAAFAGLVGSLIGLVVAIAAVTVVQGSPVWQDVSGSSLLGAMAVAVGIGALATGVRLFRLVRASRRSEVVSERHVLERGWRPLWLRACLDLVAIGIGLAILGVDAAAGGLKTTPIEAAQELTLALSFYVLLAPIFLWVGLSLLAVRILLAISRRLTSPDRARPLTSWRAAALRWLGRRPARTGIALVLGVLAIAFGTEVVTFVATYGDAKEADAQAAFGSDLRITPGDPINTLPKDLGSAVSSVSPIREVPARAESDRKTILAIDLATYGNTATVGPRMIEGSGVDALAQDPHGILVAKEVVTDFAVGVGDNMPLTLFPDDQDLSRNLNFHIIGVFRNFPPSNPPAEFVAATAALPSYLVPPPDFYMARDASGQTPDSAAAALDSHPGVSGKFVVTTLADQKQAEPRSLTALNLGGLERIEAVGAGLIAAIGVAVLGAFIVLERRREFAVLETVGADSSQVITVPALEGVVTVLGSIAIGLPVGLLLGLISVRVLGLFFILPPPLLSVPGGSLAAFVAVMLVTSALALGGALYAVTRVKAAAALRQP